MAFNTFDVKFLISHTIFLHFLCFNTENVLYLVICFRQIVLFAKPRQLLGQSTCHSRINHVFSFAFGDRLYSLDQFQQPINLNDSPEVAIYAKFGAPTVSTAADRRCMRCARDPPADNRMTCKHVLT